MGNSLIQQSNRLDYNYKSFVADTEDDLKDVPTNGSCPGSTCIIADSSKVCMLNTKLEWVEL